MNTYKLETLVDDNGKINLPFSMKNLFSHQVELTLVDLEARRNFDRTPLEILSIISSKYRKINEPEIDTSQIYKGREQNHERYFSFD